MLFFFAEKIKKESNMLIHRILLFSFNFRFLILSFLATHAKESSVSCARSVRSAQNLPFFAHVKV